ncbi:ABC-type sugar transport system, permease component [Clostridium aceticum]|uniref:ABC-type sugar transport system, permease component n=1 Tax=Clostridium aceticum TaxID=84022 RepID=A0A0D8IA13_9CLOT|nr:sugar ABC transporter permease [Clostridium aceticum]AKL95904.1 ABC-type sugar transport system, permease component [Clostridium aceticum]KJF27140.1 ABC transporter permease [Clostridium aceticum]
MRKIWQNDGFQRNFYAWVLLFPSLIFITLFTFYPITKTLHLSFFRLDLGTPQGIYMGLGNFRGMLEDEVFWKVLKNNIWFAAGTIPISMGMGMLMALALNKAMVGRSWLRTFFFYPTVIPMIAIANIWLFIYTPEYGLLNHILSWVGVGRVNWLGNPNIVMWAMIIMVIWKESGFFMIFYLAGLQNISRELYEAAEIDGASSITVFTKITFPLLMPTTLFIFIIALTNSFKLVDHLVIMTQGGPNNASNLLLYYIYETAFKFWDQGVASALTVIMLVIMVIIASIQFFGLDKKIYYS